MKIREGMKIRRRDFGDVREGKTEVVTAVIDGRVWTESANGGLHVTEIEKIERWFEEI